VPPQPPTTAADTFATTTVAEEPATTAAPPPTEAPATTEAMTTTTTEPASSIPLDQVEFSLTPVIDGLRRPVFVTAPAGDLRLFVLEQPGRVLVVGPDGIGVFLDLTGRVRLGSEQGLLGLAFHPGYASNGRFFAHYTGASGETRVEEFGVSGDPNVADPEAVRVVFTTPQPNTNHNGGMIAFGPDGHLYVALGDGGGANDQYRNGQDTGTPLGAILRLDVDGGDPYAIPEGNPFATGGGAPEIWAWGLRNPWRFAFDGDSMWIGDVGQGAWEEIDVVDHRHPGPNFGWPVLEGTHCFTAADCSAEGTILPVHEYPHEGGACSITGGVVYRGGAVPDLDGAYLFADYCSGEIGAIRVADGALVEVHEFAATAPTPTSFGTDGLGEAYVVSAAGTVYRIDAP
jgi:glucose/arabinose dehydrogenase